ncbi:MAG: MarR family winged helix-turn-helix transcriptional regulator [Anaerolineales bacterium]|jgi:DNA-binding MarR family transcriptional regulator
MTIPDKFTLVLRDWSETFMRRSMRDFVQFSKDSGLTLPQMSTLFHLHHGSSCGVSDVGELLGVTNAAASQMVDRLVQYELIERTEDPVDRRMKQLKLTNKGRAIVQDSIEARKRWMAKLTNAITPDEQISIITALTILTNAAHDLEPEINQVGNSEKHNQAKNDISVQN